MTKNKNIEKIRSFIISKTDSNDIGEINLSINVIIDETKKEFLKLIEDKIKEQIKHSKTCGNCIVMKPNKCTYDESRLSLLEELKSLSTENSLNTNLNSSKKRD